MTDLEHLRRSLRSTLDGGLSLESQDGPKAAVAALVRGSGDGLHTEILFIRRAEREGDPWSGHMGFPGGRHDQRDRSPLETARRETLEELGFDLDTHASLIGKLPPLPAMSRARAVGMIVFPYVYELHGVPELAPNHEVAEILWSPLEPLFRGECDTTLPYLFRGETIAMPGYRVGERVVWGMTHRMLQSLFERLL